MIARIILFLFLIGMSATSILGGNKDNLPSKPKLVLCGPPQSIYSNYSFRKREDAEISVGTQFESLPEDFAQREPLDQKIFLREQAILALHQLLEEAKSYENKSLQIRVKARVADLLWTDEPQNAREIVTNANNEIPGIKQEQTERHALRSEIISIIRNHDPTLAAKIIDQVEKDDNEKSELPTRKSVGQISERGALLLEWAQDLLREGDEDRAITLMQRSVSEGRSGEFMELMHRLHERNPSKADHLFRYAVDTIRQTSADPNDILFLGLYLFPSDEISYAEVEGQLTISYRIGYSTVANTPSDLMGFYLRAAADILMRCNVDPSQPTNKGLVILKGYTIQQLLPLFGRFLPEIAPTMEAELTKLGPAALEATATRGVPPDSRTSSLSLIAEGSSISDEIAKVEQFSSPRNRDDVFFDRIRVAINRQDFERARALTARLSNDALRQTLLGLIGFNEAQGLIQREELIQAEKIAASQTTLDCQAILYSLIASVWSKRGEMTQANRLTYIASVETAKIDDRLLRAKIYIYLAYGIAIANASQAFAFVEAAGQDINRLKIFNPTDNRLTFKFQRPSGGTFEYGYHGVGMLSVIPVLAKTDFLRTLRMGWSLRPEETRAFTLISACRTILVASRHDSIR